MSRLAAGRRIVCSGCSEMCVAGAARVMRHVLFFFCRGCWRDRAACEAQMRSVTEVR